MRPFLCLLSLIMILGTNQIFSKTWVDQAAAPDLSHMTECEKANYWLADRGEVNFVIYAKTPLDLKPLINEIQIAHIESGKVTAYADKHGFEEFLKYGFDYEVLTPEWLTGTVQMSDYADYLAGKRAPMDWYTYPTYSAYVGFLNKWVADYPKICKMYDLGPSGVANLNHRIYAIRISDNVAVSEPEPKYLETNTIHGDEVLNMMNSLHMIDTVLSSYGKVDRFTKMVDSLEMWIIPNMNPDGTYPRGDNTVQNAQRANVANGWDLNRNNPCPCAKGTHALYGNYTFWSNETKALQLLHSWYKFPFAQDQHGGTETYLWPYGGISSRSKDEAWYKWLAQRLVAQIHVDCNNSGYMTSCGGDGVGNIYSELYECHGIRCDMNDWVGYGKSLTLESSVTKLLAASQLKDHWIWCKEALMMSMEILYKYGLQGIVTDSTTNQPLWGVRITRNGDTLNTNVNGAVLTDSCGRYVKYMNSGTYTMKFEKTGCQTKLVPSTNIAAHDQRYNLNVKLVCNSGCTDNSSFSGNNSIKIVPFRKGIMIDNIDKNAKVGIYHTNGKLVKMLPVSSESIAWDGMDNGKIAGNGCYIVKITGNNKKLSKSFILNR